jgi:hypothetical protein
MVTIGTDPLGVDPSQRFHRRNFEEEFQEVEEDEGQGTCEEILDQYVHELPEEVQEKQGNIKS